MARVEWSRQSGDDVEAVLGILLCREHPTATRVKPSVGDGGIDVWVPEGDTATVYQIKRYTGNITATRKGHIKESWETGASF
ncbi:MAG: restriction endonuclease [Nitrososphaerales archaeon]